MTSINRLDERQCEMLRGGSMAYVPYIPKCGGKDHVSYHTETKTYVMASTHLGQINSAANNAISIGGLAALAIADSLQANSAIISTVVS